MNWRPLPASVDFGWGREPLTAQLAGAVSESDALHFEADAEALMRLRARGYLTDSALATAAKKLRARIVKASLPPPPEGER